MDILDYGHNEMCTQSKGGVKHSHLHNHEWSIDINCPVARFVTFDCCFQVGLGRAPAPFMVAAQ